MRPLARPPLVPALVLAAAVLAGGCARKREREAAPVVGGRRAVTVDAASSPSSAADAATPSAGEPAAGRHAFVSGTVVVAARVDGRVRPLRLDVATGRWLPLGSGDAHLFPTEVAAGDALLAIASEGEHEGDHVEQLAWIRGAEVARFGPRAGAIRNPTAAGDTVIVETSAASFRDLYRLDRATERPDRARRLTDDLAGNFEPALSPDGKSVVFTSSRDGDAELYRMPAAGGRPTRLTASAKDDWGARWSPDGRRLVFLSDREGSPRAFVMEADGTELRGLTGESDREIVEDSPRWSPDGRTIALVRARGGQGSIELVASEGGGASRQRPAVTPEGADDRDPTWSPDGAYLLVARRLPPGPPRVVFVRVADGAVMAPGADDALEPLALRWFPPVIVDRDRAP